ncbi:MAG: acyl-protein synthetase [Myxococcota bacterium]
MAESDELHRRVQSFIATSDPSAGSFDALACALARHQVRHVTPVRRLFASAGVDPSFITRAEEIPALPTEVFRLRRVAPATARDDARVFRTSGTTTGQSGAHPMRRLDTYREGALAWGRQMLFPDVANLRTVALLSDEPRAPHSSLTFMVARFAEALGGDASFHWDGTSLDVDGLEHRLAGGPALVAGTSFAFVMLLDALGGRPLPLAAGSRVMQTGGFKGRTREVAPDALRTRLAACFSLPVASVVAEYGMTELSSQLYQPGVRDGDASYAYLAPPWLRVTAVDPASLAPLPPGAEGLARFVDLANVDSATAIVTMDRIRVDDEGRIHLRGRHPGATPRGCSLAIEPFLETDG